MTMPATKLEEANRPLANLGRALRATTEDLGEGDGHPPIRLRFLESSNASRTSSMVY